LSNLRFPIRMDSTGLRNDNQPAGFPRNRVRPLITIQQELENPLARRILAGEFGPGDTVVVDAGKEGLAFAKGSGVSLEK
jgi:ATP-dependent Clp protease ATP-binding subunit ClpB